MKLIYAESHRLHAPEEIVVRGTIARNLEVPARLDALAGALADPLRADGHVLAAPRDWGMEWIAAVHDAGYLDFLADAYTRWQAVPNASRVIHAHAFAHHAARRKPASIQGQVGYYLSGGSCPIDAGTWQAALGSAHCALEAADLLLQGEREAYALCRPPGHHAYADFAGGFCYLNNSAIAANYLARKLGRVAIIDIDAHHGNGTQSIFYRRGDVHFVSVHGDPDVFFPFYAGYADERGEGEGAGHNLNLPLAAGTEDAGFLQAVGAGMRSVLDYAPAALLVSLGFDAYKGDPSSGLAVSTEGFRAAGAQIGCYAGPVALVQEGGYVVDRLADNLRAFLDGFQRSRQAAGAAAA